MILEVVQLVPHPDMPPKAVPNVTCSLSWQDPGHWVASFIVGAPPEALALPAAVFPARADGLWQRTCFELFLRDPGTGSYLEFNFSPSGEWAAYQFDGYRTGMRALSLADPWITSTRREQFDAGMGARLAAIGLDPASVGTMLSIPMPTPPESPAPNQYGLIAHLADVGLADAPFRELAITAVIEESDGTKSYWALAHPAGKPDFHAAESFALSV